MTERWTEKQRKIFGGLSAIGQEIAGFYEAGLKIYYEGGPNGAYFLLHAAREIDGGLRDILAVDYTPERGESAAHKKSILFSLGVEEFEGLARDWAAVSGQLHKYAHRRGAWKAPRQLEEVRPVWDEYEDILERLVGSYFAIIERIEHIGEIQNLGDDVFETVCNILAVPTYYNYFFRNKRDTKWFLPLKERGYFSPGRIEFDEQNNALFWVVLDYLERVSEQVSENPQYGKELLEIIDSIVQFSQGSRLINNHSIWWYCVKIISNLPFEVIAEHLTIERFRTWLFVWTDRSSVVADLGVVDIGVKLLPKCLDNDAALDNKYEYAETIVDVITTVKLLDSTELLGNKENLLLGLDLYWVQEIFGKRYEAIGDKCSVPTLLGLADKLKTALEYKRHAFDVNVSIGDEVYQIKVVRLLSEGARDEGISFLDGRYTCSVNLFSKAQIEEVGGNEYLQLMDIEPQDELKKFDFSAADAPAFLLELRRGLPDQVDWSTAEDLEIKLADIFEGLYSDYAYVWCKSLNDGPEYRHDAIAVLTVALRDILLSKCETHREEGRTVLDALLGNRYRFPVFKRFVLLCCDRYWADYSYLLEKFFESFPTALDESDFEVELHDILSNHSLDLSTSLSKRLKELIANVPEYYRKRGEKHSAYWQYEWLSPLRNNPDFESWYGESKEEADLKEDKPFEVERSSFQHGVSDHTSPISKEEVLGEPIEALVKYLNEFKGAGFWEATFDGRPDRAGLAAALRDAVKENPTRFSEGLDAFCDVKDHSYIHAVLAAFFEVWKAGRDVDWEKIIDFGLKYLARDNATILEEAVESEGEDSGEGKYVWIVDDIVDLIAEGCKDDTRAFDPKYFEKVETLFGLILPLLKSGGRPEGRDALMFALNTTLGKSTRAYISFSLRVARIRGKSENWGRNRYEPFLKLGIEGAIWFGVFLPQMRFLDETYAVEKISAFAKKGQDDFGWRMFMEGYLEGARVVREVYQLMRSNYIQAIEGPVVGERFDERLSQHICYGYLYFGEQLRPKNDDGQDSLFWIMLTQAGDSVKLGRWLEVLDLFWSFTGPRLPEVRDRILEFWSWSYEQRDLVQTRLGDKYVSFLARMARLSVILQKIGDVEEKWLLLCAPHVEDVTDAMFFTECLAKFDDQDSVKRIGKIFLRLLENITPTFKQDDIAQIVRRIYEKGDRDHANAICDTYGRRGFHFLRPVWEENQRRLR